MAQLFVTLLFVAIMIGAARLIAAELSRPLVNQPNDFDDWLVDQLALANDRVLAPVVNAPINVAVTMMQSSRVMARA